MPEPTKISTQIVKADPGWRIVTHIPALTPDEEPLLDPTPVIAFLIEVWEDADEEVIVKPVTCWGIPISDWWAWQRPDGSFERDGDSYETRESMLQHFEHERRWVAKHLQEAAK